MLSAFDLGFLVIVIAAFGIEIAGADAFRAADDELAAHEILIVQDFDGALGFIDRAHFNEGVSFRALGVLVAHDFSHADAADTAEEVFQIFLGGIIRQIAHVEALAGDFDIFRSTALALGTGFLWFDDGRDDFWATAIVAAAIIIVALALTSAATRALGRVSTSVALFPLLGAFDGLGICFGLGQFGWLSGLRGAGAEDAENALPKRGLHLATRHFFFVKALSAAIATGAAAAISSASAAAAAFTSFAIATFVAIAVTTAIPVTIPVWVLVAALIVGAALLILSLIGHVGQKVWVYWRSWRSELADWIARCLRCGTG